MILLILQSIDLVEIKVISKIDNFSKPVDIDLCSLSLTDLYFFATDPLVSQEN